MNVTWMNIRFLLVPRAKKKRDRKAALRDRKAALRDRKAALRDRDLVVNIINFFPYDDSPPKLDRTRSSHRLFY